MEFKNFGHKSFVKEAKIQGFVEHLAKGRLMANCCVQCCKPLFPPKAFCHRCGSEKMQWVAIADAGRLVTFSTIYYGPLGFESQTPYTLAVVSFSIGIKIFGQIDKAVPLKEIKVGMALKAVPVDLGEAQFTYLFKQP